MMKSAKTIELEMINFLSSFMKEKVGRGPRDVKVKLVDNILIFFIIDIMSTLERNISKTPEGIRLIMESRKLYLELTNHERIPAIEKIVGAQVTDHYEAQNIPKETAIGVIVFDRNIASPAQGEGVRKKGAGHDLKKNPKTIELELINFLGSFMKEKVGRGPRDIKVKMVDNVLIFFITGILSPLEKCIAQTPEGIRIIIEGRKQYLKNTNHERLPAFERIVGAKLTDHYEAWNIPKETSVGVCVFDRDIV